MSKRSFDVAIIGAGVVGCSIALELSRMGHSVSVFDRNGGPGAGTTSYSSGIIRCFYSVPEMISFSWECYQYWCNWDDHIGTAADKAPNRPHLRECGALLLRSPNAEAFIDQQLPQYERVGMPFGLLDVEETQDVVGKLGWDIANSYIPRRLDDPKFAQPEPNYTINGSIFIPETGYISDPRLATQNLAAAAEAAGATFFYNSEITDILQKNGRATGLRFAQDRRDAFCPVIVNAAGPFSNVITSMAFPKGRDADCPRNDMKLTTRPLRAEVAFLEPPPGVDMDSHGIVTADFDMGTYMRPEVGNKLLVGSIDPSCDPMEWVEGDLKEMDTNFGDQWEHCVYRAAARIPELPIPNSRSAQGVVSSYDATEDWQPILDKSSLDGFYMAIGTSGNCFKCSPVIGKIMAALIDKTENSRSSGDGRSTSAGWNHDEDPLQLALTLTGGSLNTGAFSRLRPLHQTTAGVIG